MAFTHLSKVQQNFTCFAIVCVDFLKLPLKDILASNISPKDLYKKIQSCSALTKGKKQLRSEQQNICFLPPPDVPDYNKFDVSLLYTLIRNLCPSLKPTRGWGNEPKDTDTKIGDDIERLRLLRNNTYAHAESTSIPDNIFEDAWKKMKLVIQRIEAFTKLSTNYEDELSRIKTGTFEHSTMESYKSQLQIDVDFFKDYELKDQPEISIEGIGRLSSGETAQFRANIKNADSSEWTNNWEKVKGMTTEKLILHNRKYAGSSDTVLIILHVSKEDEGFYQASISQNNKTYTSNSIELQVAEDLDNEKNSFHKNDGRHIEFAKFCQELNRDFPDDELNLLKDLIIDSTEMDSIEQAKTARECFRILKKMKLFTSNDVIIMQFLLKETHCQGLFEKCMKYAEANGAVHFKPATHPENGRTCVRFHVLANLVDYSDSYCKKLKRTVAAIVGCKHEEIEIVGFTRTKSFEVVLSLKEMDLQKLFAMTQIDHEQLYRLKVDYFIADERQVFIKSAETDDPAISIKVVKEGKRGEISRFVAEVTPIDLFGWSLSWQKIDKQISERIDTSQDKYRGSTEMQLVIQSLHKEDEGDYQAILTRATCGKYYIRSNTVSLQYIGDRPLCSSLGITSGMEDIILHFQDKFLKKLSTVRQIQWTKDGFKLNLESDGYTFGSLDDIFLKIMSPTEKDIGKYICTVTDDIGSTQQYATLGLPCANITAERTVYFGCKTRIVSKISSSPSFEGVEWQCSSDGENFIPINIGKEKHFEIDPKADYPVLTIPKTTLKDKQHYRLLVWNKIGNGFSNTLFLNVIESPPNVETSTTTDRMQRCIKLISDVFLYDKHELEDVFWTKNGEKIDTFAETNNCKYSKVSIDNPSLTIYNVSHHDAGSYQFTASNAVGSTKSDIIRLEQPNIYTEKINRESNDTTCMCFMATIESIPAVCHVQWSVKDKNDDTFRPIELNSEEYKGTSISLPHPVLFVKGKRCLENHCFQIEVTNFVGISTKSIKIDQEDLNFDKENGMKYRKLCDDLVKRFPLEKLDQLKDVLLDISRVDHRSLELAKSTQECIELIHGTGYVTSREVYFMETLLKVTNNSDLSSNLSLDEDADHEASVSTREQRALRREIEKRVSLQRSYTTSSSVSTRKQIFVPWEMEERVLTRKQRTLQREMEERVCIPIMNKATPEQFEMFQTKGSHYYYVENKTQSTTSMPSTSFYDPHKGFVLVIVNYSFPNKPLPRGNDIEEIHKLFTYHGYEVKSFTNLNKEDILSKVKLFSNKKNVGSFICFISSLGNQTSLACPDGGMVQINDILRAADTKQLKNKPKVFFIDACRSNLNQEIKERDNPEPPSSDYFVGFSCLALKTSLVGKESCGIYFQAVIEVFKDGFWRRPCERSKTRDINHFMEKVNYRVKEQKDEQGNNYQMPIHRSTLTGKLFLQGNRKNISKGERVYVSEEERDGVFEGDTEEVSYGDIDSVSDTLQITDIY